MMMANNNHAWPEYFEHILDLTFIYCLDIAYRKTWVMKCWGSQVVNNKI